MIFTCLVKFKGSHSSSLGSQVFRLQPLGPIYSQHHLLTEMKTSEIRYFTSDFSQMQTCIFANSTFFSQTNKQIQHSQTHTFIFTNTSKLFHMRKHVFSQIQTDPITNANVFTNKNTPNCFTHVNR